MGHLSFVTDPAHERFRLVEAKALAHFVDSAGRPGHTFVKNKLLSDKAGKCRLAMYPGFQFVEPVRLSLALGACEGDVRMIRTGFGDKPAEARRSGDTFLQRPQLRREN